MEGWILGSSLEVGCIWSKVHCNVVSTKFKIQLITEALLIVKLLTNQILNESGEWATAGLDHT